MPKVISTRPPTAPVNRRLRKNCRSSIGWGTRLSQYAKAPRTATAAAAVAGTRPDAQPCSGPEMIA
ncbi:hypothetical protein SGRIM128S_03355 [Streptomyces griseomycini]